MAEQPTYRKVAARREAVLLAAMYAFIGVFACGCVLFEPPGWMLPVGLFLLIVPVMLAHWGRWQRGEAAWGGILLVYPTVFVTAYTLGSIKLGQKGVLGVDPDTEAWFLYALGLAMFLIGACWRASRPTPSRPDELTPRGVEIAMLVGAVGLLAASANYATGGIPLLAGGINQARFGENEAALGVFTGFIVGAQQFAVVVLLLERFRLKRGAQIVPLPQTALVLVLLLSLALSASRTFLVLPLVAVVIVALEIKPVSAVALLLAGLAAFSLLTGYNTFRQQQSGTAEALNASLDQNGLSRFPLASGLLSLQVGPRAFQLSRDQIPSSYDYRRGSFFLADGSVLLRTHADASDSFVTTEITGRKYSVVGGTPPTVLGGFYIDWGVGGIVAGMLILGAITRRFRDRFLRGPHVYIAAAYGYWGAWMLHSIYNYVSLKPMVLTVLVAAAGCAYLTREKAPQALRPERTRPLASR